MLFGDLQGDFTPAPEGAHSAVLVSWVDRGLQAGKFGERRQVALRFELPDVETEDGEFGFPHDLQSEYAVEDFPRNGRRPYGDE